MKKNITQFRNLSQIKSTMKNKKQHTKHTEKWCGPANLISVTWMLSIEDGTLPYGYTIFGLDVVAFGGDKVHYPTIWISFKHFLFFKFWGSYMCYVVYVRKKTNKQKKNLNSFCVVISCVLLCLLNKLRNCVFFLHKKNGARSFFVCKKMAQNKQTNRLTRFHFSKYTSRFSK